MTESDKKGMQQAELGPDKKQLEVNVPGAVHAEIAAKAKAAGITRNNFIVRAIRFALRHFEQFESEELKPPE